MSQHARENVEAVEAMTKAEKIALLDRKLVAAKEGNPVEFSYEERKKLYGRMYSAVNQGGDAASQAREKLDEIALLPKGKEKAKRALLNAWPEPYFFR